MSYLVLARKYRPGGFSSVSGQEHVTRTLQNAIRREKVVHAYLFTGPRGVGKTSVARILSKALNCRAGEGSEPCQECAICREITSGTSLAVREIDGASHNSVDTVRDLIDSFRALPPPGYAYKVYIIDEVHMLSIAAFNALLKSLEEPPPNTVFILATTDVHKVPDTVISRCQRHDFRALPLPVIEQQLAEICRREGLSFEPEALRIVARLADGSMRDAQTLLDRVQSFCEGGITAAEASRALGSVDRRLLLELAEAIFARQPGKALEVVAGVFAVGIDPTTFLRDFVIFWRELFIGKLGGEKQLRALGLGDDAVVEIQRLVTPVEAIDLQDLWDLGREGADRCLRSAHPRYGCEALVVRMATREPMVAIGELIARVGSGGGGGDMAGPRGGSRAAPARASSAMPEPAPVQLSAQGVGVSATAAAPVSGAVSVTTSPGAPQASASVLSPSSKGLRWDDFLAHAGSDLGRVMLENLKRVRVVAFEDGTLAGTAAEFTVTSLQRDIQKIQEALASFGKSRGIESATPWKVTFQKGPGALDGANGEGGSSEARATPKVDPRDLHGHPAVQVLQKAFPGTKIEQVKVRRDA